MGGWWGRRRCFRFTFFADLLFHKFRGCYEPALRGPNLYLGQIEAFRSRPAKKTFTARFPGRNKPIPAAEWSLYAGVSVRAAPGSREENAEGCPPGGRQLAYC